jgi:hypothetical protein
MWWFAACSDETTLIQQLAPTVSSIRPEVTDDMWRARGTPAGFPADVVLVAAGA